MPEGTVNRLRQEVEQALRSPDLIESFYRAGGVAPMITSLEEMQEPIQCDQAQCSKIIRNLNLKVD